MRIRTKHFEHSFWEDDAAYGVKIATLQEGTRKEEFYK